MDFVQTSGAYFTLGGKRWVPVGGTTYGYTDTTARYANRVAFAVDAGLTALRFVNYLQPYSPDVGYEFTEAVWARIDYGLDQARQAGIKIILDISDIAGICSERGHAFGSQERIDTYKAFLSWLLERENTYNGRLYKNDDTIAIFAINGEIGPQGGTVIRDSFDEICSHFKTIDTNHIVHPGGQAPGVIMASEYAVPGYSSTIQQDMLALNSIDCASTHPYYTFTDMEKLHPALQQYCQDRNKPWFVEEVGYSGYAQTDSLRRGSLRKTAKLAFDYGAAGFMVWNLDENGKDLAGHSGFGISGLGATPECYRFIRTLAKMGGYSPRDMVF